MFIFNAKYLPVLDLFAGRNDVRYYLNGYSITPHPAGGALLRASNGHIACLIHDPEGRCKGSHIIKRDPDLMRAAKRKLDKKRWPGGAGEKWVAWGGRKASRLKIMATADGSPPSGANKGIEQYVAPHRDGFNGALIDGTFPDTDRLVPPEAELVPGLHGNYNPTYLRVLDEAAKLINKNTRHPGSVTAWSHRGDGKGSAFFRFVGVNGAENMLAIIMPMSLGDQFSGGSGISAFRTAPPSKPQQPQPETTQKAA